MCLRHSYLGTVIPNIVFCTMTKVLLSSTSYLITTLSLLVHQVMGPGPLEIQEEDHHTSSLIQNITHHYYLPKGEPLFHYLL
jgi:hypothetical protein